MRSSGSYWRKAINLLSRRRVKRVIALRNQINSSVQFGRTGETLKDPSHARRHGVIDD